MSTLASNIQAPAVPLKKTRSGRYQLSQKDVSSWLVLAVGVTFLFSLIFFLGFAANYKWDQFSPAVAAKIATEFFRFDKIAFADQLSILALLINTVILGFITTVLGALIGLPFGLMPHAIYPGRGFPILLKRWPALSGRFRRLSGCYCLFPVMA